jgi:hypothetical protein
METIKRWFKAHVALLAFLATVLFFFLFPNLDLLISN